MSGPLVVFAVLDALPRRFFSRELTPTLWDLAAEGGSADQGGRSVLSASTYPNHATFVTGAGPDAHRIFTSRALVGSDFVPAETVGPATPTLFDFCRERGRRAVAAVGDQNLIGVCGAARADAHWPPGGELPETAARGPLGYAADSAVVDAVDGLDLATADLLFLQLDLVDSVRHLHGADSPEATDQCRATDAALGAILQRARPRWDETLVIAVSDHDHEPVKRGAVDLGAAIRERGLDLGVDHDGTSALIHGEVGDEVLLDLPGVTSAERVAPDCTLVWGEPGQQFGIDWGLPSQHGSPRTASQMAVVGGGHPATSRVARVLEGVPHATVWAGLIRDVLAR